MRRQAAQLRLRWYQRDSRKGRPLAITSTADACNRKYNRFNPTKLHHAFSMKCAQQHEDSIQH